MKFTYPITNYVDNISQKQAEKIGEVVTFYLAEVKKNLCQKKLLKQKDGIHFTFNIGTYHKNTYLGVGV